jgi:RNA methyltransferase, TrmH family
MAFERPLITSVHNPSVKEINLLATKARERQQQQRFLVEGLRELRAAHAAGFQPVKWYGVPEFETHPDFQFLRDVWGQVLYQPVSKMVFNKLVYRQDAPSALAVFAMEPLLLQNLQLPQNPLILVLDKIEKPGNLGAMLRTADAAGVDAVLVTDATTDLYNPNVLRNSLGSFFTNTLVKCGAEEAIAFLKQNGIPIYTTWLEAAEPYYAKDFKAGAAVVMGTESTGVAAHWVGAATGNIIIPMYGTMDSLNVSNAAAIVLFEAVRQRRMV